MTDEYNALIENRTWTLVPRRSTDNVINTKWVFKVKANSDGSVERYKARLVANGMNQIQGTNYLDTFNPVVRPLSIRLVLTLAVTRGWKPHQIDISNAFLHGNLEERIVVTQPFGFQDLSRPEDVCLLHKSLYGLKQSPRCWFHRLSTFLATLNFKESAADPSLFTLRSKDLTAFLFVYVNDIVVVGSDESRVGEIINSLANEFLIRDLGRLKFFFGNSIRIQRRRDSSVSESISIKPITEYRLRLRTSTYSDDSRGRPKLR